MNRDSLILICQDAVPCFTNGGITGYCAELSFGRTNYDDIFVCHAAFEIELSKRESEWVAVLNCLKDYYVSNLYYHKEKLDSLVAELNVAIRMHNNFDLVDYLIYFKDHDSTFEAEIISSR